MPNLERRRDLLTGFKTTKDEIQNMFRLIERDLRDAAVSSLSADRRFMIAYEAGLNLATIPLYCSGYETHGQGHHWITFLLLPRFMGSKLRDLAEYFDLCRTKRNIGTYDRGGQISKTEAKELLEEVLTFKTMCENWLQVNHPEQI